MRILSVIRDFLPRSDFKCRGKDQRNHSCRLRCRFANSKANFNYDIPGFCTNPQTNTLYKAGIADMS